MAVGEIVGQLLHEDNPETGHTRTEIRPK
jgi:hypothetical protein